MAIPVVFWLVPIASICALGMAWFFFKSMIQADEGTPRMREIAKYVRDGAMAYLKQQYKVVLYVFIALAALFSFMAYVLHVQLHPIFRNILTASTFCHCSTVEKWTPTTDCFTGNFREYSGQQEKATGNV